MCGISGFTGRPQPQLLEKMVNRLVHRGPDDIGLWSDQNVSLGMRRLAIVDVESGQQPAFSEDRQLVAILNGEIYNHVELREDLERKGHHFRSHHSDTEVIPHLFAEHGIDFLNRLNGMFAIALWDTRHQSLLLARDRCGIKPLFYAMRNGQLLFGSEIKSLLAHPAIQAQPNFQALSHYFSFKNTPAPLTAFDGIYQLLPGELIIFKDGEVTKRRWWSLDFRENTQLSENEAATEVRRLLEDSVRLQMRSDVPVGAYLSGGVDSSAVVSMMCEQGAQNINTFNLAYADEIDGKNADRKFAEQVASKYGTKHHVYVMTENDLKSSIEHVLESFDEPFSGTISTFFLTRFMSRFVKVALSGDGADELFGSYLSHRMAIPLHNYDRFKNSAGFPTFEQLRALAPFQDNLEYLKGIADTGSEPSRRHALHAWTDEEKRALFTPKMRDLCHDESSLRLVTEKFLTCGTQDPLNRALFFDFETLLPDQVLAFVDRLSMAHSVEVRPPFLDHRLIEFAATLPGAMKINNGRTKHILKQALSDLLPADLLDRPKEGFVLPVNHWLKSSLKDYVDQLLSESSLKAHGLFQVDYVRQLVSDHREGRTANPIKIWNLMMFQIWWTRHFSDRAAQ